MAALVLNSSCRATPFPIPSTIRFRLPPSTFLPRKSSFPGSDVVGGRRTSLRIVRVSSDDGKNKTSSSSTSSSSSYLDMWKNAVERGRKDIEFQRIVPESEVGGDGDLEKKSVEFQKILEVSKEERDRIQRMQVIDRAAAAIAAAKSLLKETTTISSSSSSLVDQEVGELDGLATGNDGGGTQSGITFVSQPTSSLNVTPGPDFWSWTPPPKISSDSADTSVPQAARKLSPSSAMPNPVIEKDRHVEYLSIPFQSKSSDKNLETRLPPLQSLMEVQKEKDTISSVESPSLQEEHELGVQFSTNAAEAVTALNNQDKESYRVNPDGSRWWRETGIEQRPDGVMCKWTLTRGVSADEVTEWEEKYWEAADEFDYKELGSEKSGRDAWGNVWREYWKETMWQLVCYLLWLWWLVVVVNNIIEYWPDPQRGIKEAYRVLKIGGKACLIGPVYPTFWLSRFFADAWMLFPKEEEYIEWFKKAGFKDVQLKRIGPKWYRGVRRHGLIMGCSVTGVKPLSGDSPLQLGPIAEDVAQPVNPFVFLLRFVLGATAGGYYVLVPIYMWLKDQIVPKDRPI
ncbi:hypothetical protein QQ045_021226 [Rhodiola kirilowii]